jgi:glycosyltransferase involved in cell wall biosynthesis
MSELRKPPDASEPLVSIVTAVLNGARFLAETIESVRAQDYPHIEHVVIDGGSSDGTLDLLRSTPGIVWASGKDDGMYDAINNGFRMARGEVVACLNADDRYVAPGAVSAAVEGLRSRPEIDVIYGRFRYIDEDGRLARRRQPRGGPVDLRSLRRYNCVPAHATFVRKRVLTEDGHWFDPTLRFAGDWDWLLRMAQGGERLGYLDRVLSEFRLHRRSQTRTVGWRPKLEEWRRICRKNRTSFALLLWYEVLYAPMCRRIGVRC